MLPATVPPRRNATAHSPRHTSAEASSRPRRAAGSMARTAPTSAVIVRSEHPTGAHAVRVLRDAGRRFTEALGTTGELSILVTTDRSIRELNRSWREKDKPTDVLSFPQDLPPGFEDHVDSPLLGDVVVSLDTARRQANEGGRPLSQELTRLLAHGLLHLLGHDHERPAEARRMASAEVELLGTVGLVAESLAASPAELEVKRSARVSPTKTKKSAASSDDGTVPRATRKRSTASRSTTASRSPGAKSTTR